MLYSGISWNATGYEVQTVDDNGRAVSHVRFSAVQTPEMITHLRGLGTQHVAVVESTNGILDGRMMAAGIQVYRADPGLLPKRPLFGSVPADAVSRAAHRDLSALARLERNRGTQTGREAELEAWIASTSASISALSTAGQCVSHGRRDRPEVALTFDDGPLPPYTGQILDILERYGVPATFFCVGMNAGTHSAEIARMREQGHAIANHTWSHPFLPELTRPQLLEQIGRTDEALTKIVGGNTCALFRPPYGSRTPQVVEWFAEMEPKVVLWDVAPDDWAMPGSDTIAELVLDQAQPGSIILLHDGGGDRSQTVAALPRIVEGLLELGLRFVRVDDMAPTAAVSPY